MYLYSRMVVGAHEHYFMPMPMDPTGCGGGAVGWFLIKITPLLYAGVGAFLLLQWPDQPLAMAGGIVCILPLPLLFFLKVSWNRSRLHHINRAIMHHGAQREKLREQIQTIGLQSGASVQDDPRSESLVMFWGKKVKRTNEVLKELGKLRDEVKRELDKRQALLKSYLEM